MKCATTTRLMILLVVLAALVSASHQQSAQQYSWMPQGRFGKRGATAATTTTADQAAALRSLLYASARQGGLSTNRGKLTVADEPVVHSSSQGIICIRASTVGHYRCFRAVEEEESTVPE